MKENLLVLNRNIESEDIDSIALAIKKISTSSENQFNELKKERWFNRLFNMITFSNKKNIRLAEQISTLAQAQEILVRILLLLSEKSLEISELVKNNTAVDALINDDKKFVNNQIRQILRSFNAECDLAISNVTLKNIDTMRSKILRSYETLNKIYKSDGVQITKDFLENKLQQLITAHAYQEKLEDEREQKRIIQEQLKEEEKVRREIEREKAKIEKDETQFKNEISKLMKYLQKTDNEVEKTLYIDKIKECEEKLSELETVKSDVLNREKNTRAGFVYIISNIGSFGENIFKIGMTRRLEPMDRIKELSSASVPFEFDVHALIFSDDAPTLESILHNTFREYEVNKVNHRKEFFSIPLDKIEKVVTEHHNATVQWTYDAAAEEYRESLAQ